MKRIFISLIAASSTFLAVNAIAKTVSHPTADVSCCVGLACCAPGATCCK